MNQSLMCLLLSHLTVNDQFRALGDKRPIHELVNSETLRADIFLLENKVGPVKTNLIEIK